MSKAIQLEWFSVQTLSPERVLPSTQAGLKLLAPQSQDTDMQHCTLLGSPLY